MDRRAYCTKCTRRQIVHTIDCYVFVLLLLLFLLILSTLVGLIYPPCLSCRCCSVCGKVVSEDIFTEEVTFTKNAAGQSQMQDSFVRTTEADHSASRDRTEKRAYDFITLMMDNLGVGGGDQIAKPAVKFYLIAVDKNFVRGRRAEQVAAACLYITCRDFNKPFLLIEFSEFLRVNVYVLGAVFLQLCKVLHLQEHAIVRKLVDPSLFIHRFANGLLGKLNHEVEKTALRIMTSMKRDWMQTGRKPSGLCGAALYISALSHGFNFSKTDVVKVVHICEATLTKRLIEFEGTQSGSLTIEEFNQKAEEIENNVSDYSIVKGTMPKEGELLCEHKGSGSPHFAHGLCEACYIEFIKMSGGLDGGSEPPAFQRAERERLAKICADENDKISLLDAEQVESSCNNFTIENVSTVDAIGVGSKNRAAIEHEVVDGFGGVAGKADDLDTEGNESDNFSDIDDAEVDAYLHNEEETRYKKVIWEKVNWEYIEEQEQKAAAGALNVPKPKKERQQKKAEGMNAKTAAEAAHQMLSKKRASSKLNHDRLKELFDEPVDSDTPKKSRSESLREKKTEAEAEYNEDESETVDDYVENNPYEDYNDNPYDYNEECEDFDDGLY